MQPLELTGPQKVALQSQVAQLEAYAKGGVQSAIGERLAYYGALKAVGGGSLGAWISDGSVLENEQATDTARNIAKSFRALDTHQVALVPWKNEGESRVKFAIVARDVGQLEAAPLAGLWSVLAIGAAAGVLWVLSPAAVIVGAGIYLTDAYLAYHQAEAAAKETLARTQENLSSALTQAQQRGDTKTVQAILAAMNAANAAAANANPSWIDSLLGTIKSAGAGVAGGFGAAALVLLFLALQGSSSSRPAAATQRQPLQFRSPVKFHKPVSFHRPVYR